MKGYLAKDCYGTFLYKKKPELKDCRNSNNRPDVCWYGNIYEFSEELNKDLEELSKDLIKEREVKEVEVSINIKEL